MTEGALFLVRAFADSLNTRKIFTHTIPDRVCADTSMSENFCDSSALIVWDTECYFNFPITVSCTYIPTLDIDVADER